jgi:hypothetical protein
MSALMALMMAMKDMSGTQRIRRERDENKHRPLSAGGSLISQYSKSSDRANDCGQMALIGQLIQSKTTDQPTDFRVYWLKKGRGTHSTSVEFSHSNVIARLL